MICPVCLAAGKGRYCPQCGVWMSDGFDDLTDAEADALADETDPDDD